MQSGLTTPMRFFLGLPLVGWLLLMSTGCHSPKPVTTAPPEDWLQWKAKRLESVGGTNGWTTLIARHWLAEGDNFIGSSPTNQLVLPAERAAASLGKFTRTGTTVHFVATPGVGARLNGMAVESVTLESDQPGPPSRLQVGDLVITVIVRGNRVGLRIRDPQSPARKAFNGIETFPYDPAWRVPAKFDRFLVARRLKVDDVIGGTQEFASAGVLSFVIGGKEHQLTVAEEPGEPDFFILFRDKTAGHGTYGSGRFLYVQRPAEDGSTIIDFNRAYTPPCGFTAFATCPLPPSQNHLPLEIRAGEKAPAHPPH